MLSAHDKQFVLMCAFLHFLLNAMAITTINAAVTTDPSTASTSNPFTLITTFAAKSFTTAIGSTRSTSIPFKSPSTHRGEPALFFSD